jgi:hypothetical protein
MGGGAQNCSWSCLKGGEPEEGCVRPGEKGGDHRAPGNREPSGRRDGAELAGADDHGSLGELGHGERAWGKGGAGEEGRR